MASPSLKSNVLKVGLCQLNSIDSASDNLSSILELIESQQAKSPVNLFCFPENALYFKMSKADSFAGFTPGDDIFNDLRAAADVHGVHILIGSAPEADPSGKCANSTFWVQPGQAVQSVYRKIHLFDVDVEGAKPERESDRFVAGTEAKIISINGWKIGLSICYDIRFSSLYALYAKNEVDVVMCPSAFLVPTGKAHWETLMRARAIESQCYMVAAAQSGHHVSACVAGATRDTYGHAFAVSPWGEILEDFQESGPACKTVELTRAKIDQVRRQIPMKGHRVSDLGLSL